MLKFFKNWTVVKKWIVFGSIFVVFECWFIVYLINTIPGDGDYLIQYSSWGQTTELTPSGNVQVKSYGNSVTEKESLSLIDVIKVRILLWSPSLLFAKTTPIIRNNGKIILCEDAGYSIKFRIGFRYKEMSVDGCNEKASSIIHRMIKFVE